MYVESVGTACPPYGIQMEDREQIAEQFVSGDQRDRWFVENIFEKTTIRSRPSAILSKSEGDLQDRQTFFLPTDSDSEYRGPTTGERMRAYEEYVGELALEACQDAFLNSQFGPETITHLVTASCTGCSAPGFDIHLIEHLPLAPTVERTHLGFMGCHAGLNCLRVADAIARSDSRNRVLICCAELCSLHYQYTGAPDQIVANALFADGAGSAIVTSGQAEAASSLWKIESSASCIVPGTSELMKWNIDDFGFTMKLSDRIPETIKTNAGPWLTEWLESKGINQEDVASWAVHPGGPQILNAFEIAMSLEAKELNASRELLRDNGNMSSASFFFLLKKLRSRSGNLPCVAVGFGPGITVETALFL